MKRRIFLSIFLTSLAVLLITVSVVMITVYNEFTSEEKSEIRAEADTLSTQYNGDTSVIRKAGQESRNRITLIAADGTVLYDSRTDSSALDDHGGRPEISAAFENGNGEATRTSDTLGTKTYYYALKLSDGCVIRVAAEVKSMTKIIDNTATYIMLILLFSVMLAAVVGRVLTRRIVSPVNSIDPENPLRSNVYEELSPLVLSMDRQNRKIAAQLRELSAKQRELSETTDKMSESLVMFSADRRVLFANRSAKRMFSSLSPEGLTYLELCREMPYIRALEKAFHGDASSETVSLGGRIYRLGADPVGGNVSPENPGEYAAVLFAADVTDAERTEQMRREFSANVSHELKTPLTTIMGCAEIMNSGVAKKEDFPHFITQIYDEAKRLLTLIEDIIRLSRLDEGSLSEEFTNVDLYDMSLKVIAELSAKAASRNVIFETDGSHITVRGIESTLHEMIYNLCDNAIIYNKSGGKVTLSVKRDEKSVILSVADTGIGIAPEHQERIFERFYRVDKSHSKASGGTGLGLSIVKHGAFLHNAQVRLTSIPGQGSEISLIFQE